MISPHSYDDFVVSMCSINQANGLFDERNDESISFSVDFDLPKQFWYTLYRINYVSIFAVHKFSSRSYRANYLAS